MTSATSDGSHYYHPRALLNIPRRLFRPPDPGAERVGRVTQLSLTPVYEVKLEDILAEKHLPPLTLTEFKAYLLYTEHSPENLHFIMWFQDYEKRFKRWTESSTYPEPSASLAANFSQAQETFFRPSFLELNLPAETLASLQEAVPRAHPAPAYFADVRHQVDTMLRESLCNFVRSRSANVGRNRGLVAIVGGLCVMCVGVVPIILSVRGRGPKWLRFAALPCFWFGCTAFVCGLHGLCLLIYIFGDARQLTVYELARPRSLNNAFTRKKIITLNTASDASSHRTSPVDFIEFSLTKPTGNPEDSEQATGPEPPKPHIPPEIQVSPVEDKYVYEVQDSSYPPQSPSTPAAIAPFLSTPEPASPAETVFDFDQLPSRMFRLEKDLTSSPPAVSPLTIVLDRISIRTYWDTFARSTTLAFLVACTLVGVSFAGT